MLIKTNFHYPAMLRVAGKNCVIIGGGAVAARKLATLLAAEAKVTVVAPLSVTRCKSSPQRMDARSSRITTNRNICRMHLWLLPPQIIRL